MYVCIYIDFYLYIHSYICLYVHVCVYMYVCIYMYVCVYTYMCLYTDVWQLANYSRVAKLESTVTPPNSPNLEPF